MYVQPPQFLTGKEGLEKDKFFKAASKERGLRGHSKKLYNPRCNTTARLKTFSMRAIIIIIINVDFYTAE